MVINWSEYIQPLAKNMDSALLENIKLEPA